jgi:hypothetical protein
MFITKGLHARFKICFRSLTWLKDNMLFIYFLVISYQYVTIFYLIVIVPTQMLVHFHKTLV